MYAFNFLCEGTILGLYATEFKDTRDNTTVDSEIIISDTFFLSDSSINMEDGSFLEGHSLFIVIFLLIFVVGLSCGLLGFICMKILEDRCGDGIGPTMFFNPRTVQTQELMSNAPTKIIVTSPPVDESQDTSQSPVANDKGGLGLDHPIIKVKSKARGPSGNRVGPSEKVIYSNENSPVGTPTKKVFVWSKSNYDFEQTSDKEKDDDGRKSRGRPKTPKSPLSLFNTFVARSYSPPATLPAYTGRRHSVLHF